jgi:hypothetical protein
MNLINLLKRQNTEPPVEVIQAACDLYGLILEYIASIRVEKLIALSHYLWLITLNITRGVFYGNTPQNLYRCVAKKLQLHCKL